MIKKIIVVVIFIVFFLTNTPRIFALGETDQCYPTDALLNHDCNSGLFCKPFTADPTRGSCAIPTAQDTLGKISPPPAIKTFIDQGQTGAGGISMFLNNLITLFYSLAAIVLIFMLLWGAFEWITSGGDKEAVAKARSRIISAFIGILLFAVTFAVIRVLGTFTGFTFFAGQNYQITDRDPSGNILQVKCLKTGDVYSTPGWTPSVWESWCNTH